LIASFQVSRHLFSRDLRRPSPVSGHAGVLGPCTKIGLRASIKTSKFYAISYYQAHHNASRRCVAMAGPQSFLDNLKNLRLVMSVALEHTEQNRNQFLKSASREQVRQTEISISKVRSLAEQLEKEFKVLETFAIQKRRQLDN
jgi:hypothetical protein